MLLDSSPTLIYWRRHCLQHLHLLCSKTCYFPVTGNSIPFSLSSVGLPPFEVLKCWSNRFLWFEALSVPEVWIARFVNWELSLQEETKVKVSLNFSTRSQLLWDVWKCVAHSKSRFCVQMRFCVQIFTRWDQLSPWLSLSLHLSSSLFCAGL